MISTPVVCWLNIIAQAEKSDSEDADRKDENNESDDSGSHTEPPKDKKTWACDKLPPLEDGDRESSP